MNYKVMQCDKIIKLCILGTKIINREEGKILGT